MYQYRLYSCMCTRIVSCTTSGYPAYHGDGVHGVKDGEEENVIFGVGHVRGDGATHTWADAIWRSGTMQIAHIHDVKKVNSVMYIVCMFMYTCTNYYAWASYETTVWLLCTQGYVRTE